MKNLVQIQNLLVSSAIIAPTAMMNVKGGICDDKRRDTKMANGYTQICTEAFSPTGVAGMRVKIKAPNGKIISDKFFAGRKLGA